MKEAKRGRGSRRAKCERPAKIAWTAVPPRPSPREEKVAHVSKERRVRVL